MNLVEYENQELKLLWSYPSEAANALCRRRDIVTAAIKLSHLFYLSSTGNLNVS